jgi:hypothetical protein
VGFCSYIKQTDNYFADEKGITGKHLLCLDYQEKSPVKTADSNLLQDSFEY